jgi:hypothetical protein
VVSLNRAHDNETETVTVRQTDETIEANFASKTVPLNILISITRLDHLPLSRRPAHAELSRDRTPSTSRRRVSRRARHTGAERAGPAYLGHHDPVDALLSH